MSTELVQHAPAAEIAEQMKWAQAVVVRPDGGAASMLPETYRNNPANVLIAVGLGQSMGLSFAESLYRISVIKGKPSASAELIAANVRKAGHRLRIRVTENPPSATCTIIRADDPDEPTVITRDMEWAQRMGLASEPNYKKQPSTMLSWRAISACARLACPEALYGVVYTPDEVGDAPDTPTAPRPTAADFVAAPATAPAPLAPDVEDAVEVPDERPEPKLSARNRGRLFALFAQKGVPESDQFAGIAHVIGRTPTHRDAINEDEFARVVAQLETLPDALKTDADQ